MRQVRGVPQCHGHGLTTWTPYPNHDNGEFAEVSGLVLVARHDGTWAVFTAGSLERHREAFLTDGALDRSSVLRPRASADNWPRKTSTLWEAKQAAEVAAMEMSK